MCADAADDDAMRTDRSPPARAIPLYLMAKAPQAGEVKTRMRPELNPAESAQLARLMLEQTVDKACRHWPGEVALCVSPDPDHPAFARLARKHRLAVTPQADADLGGRMMTALTHGIARAGCAAVLGCDVPHCRGDILVSAHAMLARGDNPVGPAADGGFYLIGLQRGVDESLFNGIDWNEAATLAAVRARAAAAGVRLCELPPLRDIDRYPDLQWLAGVDAAYQPFVA